jgi:hypothetical protein
MAIFGLVFGMVALVLIGIGVVIGLVACALTAVLLALGIVSSSVFVGVRSGRATSGIRAFLIQIGLLCGIPAGALCAWLAKSFFAAYGGDLSILIYGAMGGAFAGLLIALMLDFLSRRAGVWAGARIEKARQWQSIRSPKEPIEVLAQKVD